VFTTARNLSRSTARSIQFTPTHSTSLTFIFTSTSHLRLGLPRGLLTPRLPTKILYIFLLSPHTTHVPSVSPSLMWSAKQQWLSSTNHEAPHYAVFSSHLSLPPSQAQPRSPAPVLEHPHRYQNSFVLNHPSDQQMHSLFNHAVFAAAVKCKHRKQASKTCFIAFCIIFFPPPSAVENKLFPSLHIISFAVIRRWLSRSVSWSWRA
jgi:hypothetical protein